MLESVSKWLVIDINILYDGEFHLSKTGLVTKVLEATVIDNWYGFPTSTRVYVTLRKDDDNPEANIYFPNAFPYVIGMMLYLVSNRIPDILSAVCWCDQLTHNTKQQHDNKLKTKRLHTKETKFKVIVLHLIKIILLDCYGDTYFERL